jgi:hypothetical protein
MIIIGYAATNLHKRVICTADWDDSGVGTVIGTFEFRWKSTAAITRLTFAIDGGGTYANNGIFTLYGMQ